MKLTSQKVRLNDKVAWLIHIQLLLPTKKTLKQTEKSNLYHSENCVNYIEFQI